VVVVVQAAPWVVYTVGEVEEATIHPVRHHFQVMVL
jgi:hypothetical protein